MKLRSRPPFARAVLLAVIALLGIVSLSHGAQEEGPKRPEEPGRLMVTVVNEDGEPVIRANAILSPSKAQMEARQGGGIRLEQAHTDPDGKVILSVAPGEERELSVSSSSRTGERVTRTIAPLAAGEVRPIDIVLRTKDDATYTAIVLDGATGKPLPGVIVDVHDPETGMTFGGPDKWLRAPASSMLRTDAKGAVTFPAATWRKRTAALFAEGFAVRFLMAGGDPKANGLDAPHEVRLDREAILQVRLVDVPDGSSVRATLYSSALFSPAFGLNDFMSLSKYAVEAEALDDGETFALYGLPPDTSVEIVVRKDRQTLRIERSVITPAAGKEKRLALDLATDGVVRGKALDVDGNPVAGKEVWIGETGGRMGFEFRSYDKPFARQRTADDGTFEFKGLAPAEYMVAYGAKRGRGQGMEVPIALGHKVEVINAGGPVDVLIQEVMGLTISGKLLGPDGDPMKGFVMATEIDTYWNRQLNLHSGDGTFTLGPLLPGKYSLRGNGHGNPHAAPVDMEVVAGAKDVVVQLALGGRLEGTIVDGEGAPVDGAELRLCFGGGSRSTMRRVKDGVFSLDGVAPEPFAVYAEANDGRISNVYSDPIVPGTTQSGITLTLAPPAQLSLTATDVAPRTVFSLKSEAGFVSTEVVRAGETKLVSVPPGSITVTARPFTKELVGTATVNAIAGKPVTVNITLKAEGEPKNAP